MASCTGKPKFKTEGEVQKALKNTVAGIQSFHCCSDCGNYHLGDKPQPRPARKVRRNTHTARR